MLVDVGVEVYVDLCYIFMVFVLLIENLMGGELFYDCLEKFLEFKWIFSNRKVNILVIVNGL